MWHADCEKKCIFKNVHPQNSNHLRSHSRAITAPGHSRLGLGNKFSGKQIRPNFLCSTSFLYKILPTNLGVCKPTFYTFYTSHRRWNSTIYHTYLRQNAVFHNFSRQVALNSRNRSQKFTKSPFRPVGSHF